MVGRINALEEKLELLVRARRKGPVVQSALLVWRRRRKRMMHAGTLRETL